MVDNKCPHDNKKNVQIDGFCFSRLATIVWNLSPKMVNHQMYKYISQINENVVIMCVYSNLVFEIISTIH